MIDGILESMVNTMVLASWTYLKYLQYRMQFSSEQNQMTKFMTICSLPVGSILDESPCLQACVHTVFYRINAPA